MNEVRDFIKSYPTKRTQSTYETILKKYFEIIKADSDNYFKQQRNYEEDIKKFWKDWLITKTPCTRTSYSACVNVFLEENNVVISKKVWKNLKRKIKGKYPVTLDVIPTQQELKQILTHGEVKAKALFLVASSSGMRINEILQLRKEDVKLDLDPVKVEVRAEYTKLKQPRITYISDEAKIYLVEWLKIRDKYLDSAVKKIRGVCTKDLTDDTIFCFGYTLASKMWNRLLKNSGFDAIDPTTKYHKMHIHTLRKYFKTNMLHAGVQESIVNQLVGHTKYLDSSYLRFSEKDLAEGYKRGIKSLLVFETNPDLTEHTEQIKKLESDNEKLKELVEKMQMKMDILENKYNYEKLKNGKK